MHDDGVSIDGKTIDGSTFTLTKGYTYNFNIITHGDGYLNAWMDHDAGGSFDSGDEHFINEHRPDANNSTNIIPITIPQTTTLGTTYMRFRYSDKSGTTPTGRDASSSGEVEDYKVIIQDSGGVSGKVYNDKNGNGTQDAGEDGIAGVSVHIVAANGEEQEVDTNANGEYSFRGVAGDATVTIDENSTALEHSIKTTGTTNPTPVTVVANEDTLEENNGYQKQANLVTTKTVNKAAPQVGETIKYTLTVTNNGPASATGVFLTDELPSGVTFVNANTAQGSYDASTGVWSIGTLNNNDTATLELEASVDSSSAGQEITNRTTPAESPDTGDPTGEDDNLSAKINVGVKPGLIMSDVTVTEGETLHFTVTLQQASTFDTKIKFNTVDGTGDTGATSPEDYTALVDHVVTIKAGATEATVNVSTEDDTDVELTETFTLNGVVIEGQTENPNVSAIGTILDNDGDAAVGNITDDTVNEGETLRHVVTMNAPASTVKTYNFSFEDIDTNASDYTFAGCEESNDVTCDVDAGTITVKPYVTTFTIKVQSHTDSLYEGEESYTVKVGDKEAIGKIQDLTAPEIASISDAEAIEGQVLTHTVTMTGASSSVGIFPFEIEDKETTAGEDYSTTYNFSEGVTYDGTHITVRPGITTFDVNVTSNIDNVSDNGETYTIHIKDKTATGTIIDVETPTVSISDSSVVEGGILTFNVSLSMESTENIVLTFSEDESSTATPSEDYKSFSRTYWVIIPPNTLNAEFTIETINDEIKEDVEEYINLTANVVAGQTSNEYVTARGTILDDDNDIGVGSIEDAFALEGRPLYHKVIMSGISDLEERYDFNIENLTTSDDDYDATPIFSQNVTYDGDQIIVPRHTSEFYVIIQSTADADYEPEDENYNISIEDKEAIGTIHDYIEPAVLRDDNETHKILDNIPDTINILENDDFGVVTSTIKLYSNVPGTVGNGTKELVVPNEGTWSIDATGTLLFVPLLSSIHEEFQPTEITYDAIDDNGYTLSTAIANIVYDDVWDP